MWIASKDVKDLASSLVEAFTPMSLHPCSELSADDLLVEKLISAGATRRSERLLGDVPFQVVRDLLAVTNGLRAGWRRRCSLSGVEILLTSDQGPIWRLACDEKRDFRLGTSSSRELGISGGSLVSGLKVVVLANPRRLAPQAHSVAGACLYEFWLLAVSIGLGGCIMGEVDEYRDADETSEGSPVLMLRLGAHLDKSASRPDSHHVAI